VPIAKHASSPDAKASASSAAVVSNSFSPPAGSLVVVLVGQPFTGGGGTASNGFTCTSTGPAGAWTRAASIAFSYAQVAIFYRYFPTAPGAITVTTTPPTPGGGGSVLQDVRVYTGADPMQNGGTVAEQRAGRSDFNASIRTTKPESLVVGLYSSMTESVTPTPVANWKSDWKYEGANASSSSYTGTRTIVTGTPGATSVGWSMSKGSNGGLAFFEIVPLGEASTPTQPETPSSNGTIASSSPAPPYIVQEAYLAPTSRIERRVEIYENDGVMPWKPELWDRLVDGSVSADYSRDERRSVELTLDNYDGLLQHSPTNLWYDKVFKVFYGIHVNEKQKMPSVVIVEEYDAPGQAVQLKNMLNRKGFTRVRINLQATGYEQIYESDIVVSISADYSRKLGLLQEAYARGKSVLTCNLQSTAAQLPQMISAAAASVSSATTNSISPSTSAPHPLNSGWAEWAVVPGKSYRKITTPAAGAVAVGRWYDDVGGFSPAVLVADSPSGPSWVHLQQAIFDPAQLISPENCENFLGRAMEYLDVYEPVEYWETQIGEFMVDALSDDETGDLIMVTGRDYTKRCLLSKFANATAYTKGQNIGTIIRSIAVNAGITKFNLPIITDTLQRDLSYERSTERWKAMKEIADASNYELYFDSKGFMVMRKYNDPLLTPPTLELTTGQWGNLVSVGNKASDARLFNHVIVVGETNDSTIPPVAAEAKNVLASSPSSIQRIGDRVTEVKSTLVTTVAQAQQLANTYLRVSSLEEFELDFSAILLPWIEPGEILEIEQERAGNYLPTRYLISSITLPLDLGPMSGNGKRVTIVL
jgi:hypothetical protein